MTSLSLVGPLAAPHPRLLRSSLPLLALALLAGCGKSNNAGAADASADGAAPEETYGVTIGGPFSADRVVAAVNPKHLAPYAGPKGTLRGIVRIEGDPPPDTGLKFPDRCRESGSAVYGKLFRVGLDKALADALVMVADYADRGFVPAAEEMIKIPLHQCAPAKRSYTVTFGQRIEVSNLDKTDSYVPFLDGAVSRTAMVAVPQGSPIKLYPSGPSPSHYMLRDQLGSGLVADVFVLNYATHDVTGLDGRYEIKNIPVGQVKVAVMLPVIGKSVDQSMEIKEGDNTLDLTLHFDASKDIPGSKPAASASASASAKAGPAGSASAKAGPAKPPPPKLP